VAFEKEIKAAQQIVDGWKKEAQNYVDLVTTTKKGPLKSNKDLLEKVAIAAAARDPNVNLKDKYGQDIIEAIRDLKQLREGAERNFKKFKEWSMDEPRSSMKAINSKLKLSKEAYAAAEVGIRKQLSEVSEVVQAGERAWKADLMIAIDNWITKAEALNKIINENATAKLAIHAQFSENAKRFMNECDRILAELKPERLKNDMRTVADANKVKELSEEQKLHIGPVMAVFRTRATSIPKTIELLEKNVLRVFKSAPPDSDGIGNLRKVVNVKYEDTRRELEEVQKIYVQFVSLGEKKGWI